ncbi:MAG: 3-dehydroquinate synthase [Muriicola sp.]|nr:3-dehydroquinate synthase [Muriicola sp.]NNK11562.1 3-dehydroquinate synthase [Flavobacteriaceae bacterium]
MESILTETYSIYFNEAAYLALNEHLKKERYSKIFILVDENTHRDCLPVFLSSLETKLDVEVIEMEAGEMNKTIETCIQIWHALSELGGDRRSLMINLGGGVVTDLGGFVASTFKRGIDFINVPTSLLAMVDASIGGKTGVDLGVLKNQVGVINQPRMVMVMVNFLSTLHKRQMSSGFAEMLKHGLITSEAYWSQLKEIRLQDPLDGCIYQSIQIKNKIVLQDPRENNLRKILNFGHTLGHAIESHFLQKGEQHALLHGEAIAIGMILEAYLSSKLSGMGDHQLEDIKHTLLERYKKVRFSEEDKKAVLSLLIFDKKNSHGLVNFVLLKRIGDSVIDQRVPEHLFMEAFAYYEE